MDNRASIAGRPRRRPISSLALACVALAGTTAASAAARPDGASPDPEFGRVTLPTGVELHYAELGEAGDPAVLLLHGYSDSWFSYSRILPLLPEGRRYIAPDLRGHGRSARPDAGYAMDGLAADVLALMDALGIARATVVGHSMGSFIAQRVSSLAPGRVDGLVLIASATSVEGVSGVDDFARAIGALEDPVSPEFVREFQAGTVFAPVPQEFMETVVDESLGLPARVWQALFEGMRAAGSFPPAGRPATPTLLLWGDRDAMMPRAEQDALLRAFPAATLIVYEQTGHAPHWERPERVADDLRAFLDAPESLRLAPEGGRAEVSRDHRGRSARDPAPPGRAADSPATREPDGSMAELKTRLHDGDVRAFLESVENETRRADAFEILELMRRVTGEEPRMWGPSIVGFGEYRYAYDSGREGDWFVAGFSPRKQALTLYIMSGFDGHERLLERLGRHTTGRACLYVKKLADVDLEVLEELVRRSVEHVSRRSAE